MVPFASKIDGGGREQKSSETVRPAAAAATAGFGVAVALVASVLPGDPTATAAAERGVELARLTPSPPPASRDVSTDELVDA